MCIRDSSLAAAGTASAIGASSNVAANLVLNGGDLQYTGVGATTDRLLTLGNLGGTLDASGAGALVINGNAVTTNQIVDSGTGTRTLILTGTNTSQNLSLIHI